MSNRERNLYIIVPLVWLILLGMACGVAALRHHPGTADQPSGDEHSLAPEAPGSTALTLPGAHAIIAPCPLNRRAQPPLTPPWTI
jgi:hypothetical protein